MSGASCIEEIERCTIALSGLEARSLAAEELGGACVVATRLVNVALAQASVLLAEFHQRGDWADDGALSVATWVANRTGERRSELAARARAGTLLRQVPTVAAASAAGEITFDHARR